MMDEDSKRKWARSEETAEVMRRLMETYSPWESWRTCQSLESLRTIQGQADIISTLDELIKDWGKER